MSTPPGLKGPALYYPFHLCHERTLQQLLDQYATVHFRDYMALQLTSLSGTTAAAERMGDTHPDLVRAGRLVQGYPVSGPLHPETRAAVDRDLDDMAWRTAFHTALQKDRRFQRGLFDLSHAVFLGAVAMPGPAFLLRLIDPRYQWLPFSVNAIAASSLPGRSLQEAVDSEYGLALVKTSASLVYTMQLCLQHGLTAVTDSATHFTLLQQSCTRERVRLGHYLLPREGY